MNLQKYVLLSPMLSQMKQASQRLNTATVLALRDGDQDAATTHLLGTFGMIRGMTEERMFIFQLVRIAIAHITQAATWELLQSTNTTDAQLEMIQREWKALDFILPAARALEMERAMNEMTIGDMRESRTEYSRVAGDYGFSGSGGSGGGATWAGSRDFILETTEFAKDTWGKTKDATKEISWRVAWSYSDQLRMLKGIQIQIETLRTTLTNRNFKTSLDVQRTRLNDVGFRGKNDDEAVWSLADEGTLKTMFSSGVLSLGRTIHKVMTIEASKQLTVTAIALKRYKLRHGKLSADLAALVPEFLPAVPFDPVNAQPLHYKPNADGTFLLYSVGEYAEDNGGDPKPAGTKTKSNSWQRGRDWVWPQPASAQEIEDFYQQQRGK
jgi:hypothetical protein